VDCEILKFGPGPPKFILDMAELFGRVTIVCASC